MSMVVPLPTPLPAPPIPFFPLPPENKFGADTVAAVNGAWRNRGLIYL